MKALLRPNAAAVKGATLLLIASPAAALLGVDCRPNVGLSSPLVTTRDVSVGRRGRTDSVLGLRRVILCAHGPIAVSVLDWQRGNVAMGDCEMGVLPAERGGVMFQEALVDKLPVVWVHLSEALQAPRDAHLAGGWVEKHLHLGCKG